MVYAFSKLKHSQMLMFDALNTDDLDGSLMLLIDLRPGWHFVSFLLSRDKYNSWYDVVPV